VIHTRTLVTFAAALTLAGAGSAARAADPAPSVRVVIADLDLSRSEDAQVLDERLRTAARRVCNVDARRPLAERALETRCIRESLDRAYVDLAAMGRLPSRLAASR
jgi:UrcA family protein